MLQNAGLRTRNFKKQMTLFLLLTVVFTTALMASVNAAGLTTVQNGLYQGQDPWIIYQNGFYYLCQSGPYGPTAIHVSKSSTLADQGDKIKVYQSNGALGRIFAPELHYLNEKWYIYACADVASMSNRHQAVVFQAATDDPQGPFNYLGVLYTGTAGVNYMANDFTVFTVNNQLYACWGCLNVPQFPDPYEQGPAIAPMASPTQITVDRSFLPRYVGGEGPRVLQKNGKTFITVSVGGWATKGYHLGMYTNTDGNVLNQSSWTFQDNVFNGLKDAGGNFTGDIWGPGRASFTKSVNGTEDWMMYHSKVWPADDNGWRQVNIQKFTWNANGTPNFGTPIQQNVLQNLPAGDPGLGDVYQAENAARSGGAGINTNNAGYTGTGFVDSYYSVGANTTFTVNVTSAGDYLVTLRYSNGVYVLEEQRGEDPKIEPPAPGTVSIYVNGVKIKQTGLDKTTDWSHWMLKTERLRLNQGSNTISYKFDSGDTGLICLDYIAVRIAPPIIYTAQFSDNFNDGNANGWTTYGGTWSVVSGQYTVQPSPGPKSIANSTFFSNFTYDADLTIVSGQDAGLIFRVTNPAVGTDSYSGYYAGLNTGGYVVLGKANNNWTQLATSSMTVTPNTLYHLRVVANGSNIKVYVTSMTTPKINFNDTSYTAGAIGLRTFNANAKFDNIAVSSGAVFYQNDNYGGTAVILGKANYTLSQLNAAGIPNDWMTSLKVPSGWTVDVYQNDNFGGTMWRFTTDNPNVGSACNDQMSSVKIY